MSSSTVTKGATKTKLSKRQRAVDGRDILSNLPESILSHILSFLPTKDAVRTSVLSKRWVQVWTAITLLDFDDASVFPRKRTEKKHFVNFVNTVLRRLTTSSIRSFSLKLRNYEWDPRQVFPWISAVLRRGVQKLQIQNPNDVQLHDEVFISSLFLCNCNSLVELDLQMKCTVRVQPCVCFPNFKVLRLNRITFEIDSSTSSEELVLNFPVLKVFDVKCLTLLNVQSVSIQAPLLESLSIVSWNFTLLSEEFLKYTIKISAFNLVKFNYFCFKFHDVILFHAPSAPIASADICILGDKEDSLHDRSLRACILLRQFHQVEHLRLDFRKLLPYAKDIFTNLPTFERLKRLKLSRVTEKSLLDLLHKSPVLESLVLHEATVPFEEDLVTSAMVPCCFMSCLRRVKIEEFERNHLCLAKFVVENAPFLEQMTITPAYTLRKSYFEMEEVREQLLSFPKCSANCVLLLL